MFIWASSRAYSNIFRKPVKSTCTRMWDVIGIDVCSRGAWLGFIWCICARVEFRTGAPQRLPLVLMEMSYVIAISFPCCKAGFVDPESWLFIGGLGYLTATYVHFTIIYGGGGTEPCIGKLHHLANLSSTHSLAAPGCGPRPGKNLRLGTWPGPNFGARGTASMYNFESFIWTNGRLSTSEMNGRCFCHVTGSPAMQHN